MPSGRTHSKRQNALLGKANFKGGYDALNSWIDEPHKYLGRKHRVLRHDSLTPILAMFKFNSPKAAAATVQHIADDTLHSQVKKLLAKIVGPTLVYE